MEFSSKPRVNKPLKQTYFLLPALAGDTTLEYPSRFAEVLDKGVRYILWDFMLNLFETETTYTLTNTSHMIVGWKTK